MVNVNKLKGKIVENGMNVAALAKAIGIDTSTLYRKLNSDGDTLTIKEARTIGQILTLTGAEMNEIFFVDFVA